MLRRTALAVLPAVLTATSLSTSTAAAEPARPERVEVQRTERSQLYANADGTYTLEQAAAPVRVRRGDGWVDVDTTHWPSSRTVRWHRRPRSRA